MPSRDGNKPLGKWLRGELRSITGDSVEAFAAQHGFDWSAVYTQLRRGFCHYPRITPGTSTHPLQATYKVMKDRCYSPGATSYPLYGARGIRVCPRWFNSFWTFVEDMGDRPDGHTLDRIDNDGDYEPSNCRWATRQQQALNKRDVGTKTRPFIGVEPSKKKWRARIRINGVLHNLGFFHTAVDAALAYDAAAREGWGAQAVTNFDSVAGVSA